MNQPDPADTLEYLLKNRKSIRAFKPDPVPDALLERAFAMAGESPSNCNTQPWSVYLVSGEAQQRLKAELLRNLAAGQNTPDIPYLMDRYTPEYRERQVTHITIQQQAFGATRDDKEGRKRLAVGNMNFWGAPHVAYLFMPAFGNEREAADMGMFAQSLMLACTALGLGSCPQTSIGLFASPVRRMFAVPDTLKLLFGIAIGYVDESSAASRLVQTRRKVADFLTRSS